MNTELWKKSTNKLAGGAGLYYLAPIFAFFMGLGDGVGFLSSFMGGESSSSLGSTDIWEYVSKGMEPLGALIFFLGLNQFRYAVNKADMGDVERLRNAVILLFIGSIVDFIPLPFIGWIAGIINIIAICFMLKSFSRLKTSHTFPISAQKGASKLHVAMILTIIAILIGWIPLISIIGNILSIIAFLLTLSGWSTIAKAASDNVIEDNINPESTESSSEGGAYYEEANKKTDKEISSVLGGSTTTLDPRYIEALKDVQAKRKEKKDYFDDAMGKTAEEVDMLLSNPTTLNLLYVRALRYIKRCNELESKPTYEGFLHTFDRGYIEPETPAEIEARIERERVAAKARKQMWMVLVPVLALMMLFITFGPLIMNEHDEYKEIIGVADSYYSSGYRDEDAFALKIYNKALSSLPLFGKKEKTEYIQHQIAKLEIRIAEEEARIAEEARKKEEARKLAAKKRAEFRKRVIARYPSRIIDGKFLVAMKDADIDNNRNEVRWDAAVRGCARYNEDVGGRGKWRIPKIDELMKIGERRKYFRLCWNKKGEDGRDLWSYWSKSEMGGYGRRYHHMIVDLYDDEIRISNLGGSEGLGVAAVRCILPL